MSLVTVTAYPLRDAAQTAQRALDTAGIDAEVDQPDEEAFENACPTCDSLDVASTNRAQTFLLVSVLIMAVGVAADITQAAFFGVLAAAVYQLVRGRWRCTACGETWD